MDNLLFNNRFAYQQAAPSQEPMKVEEIEMEAEVVEGDQEKPSSLEELQAAIQQGNEELIAHYRKMEGMIKEIEQLNPALAKRMQESIDSSKIYQAHKAKVRKEIGETASVLDYMGKEEKEG